MTYSGCRNTDAGGIGLDAYAQICGNFLVPDWGMKQAIASGFRTPSYVDWRLPENYFNTILAKFTTFTE
jgi:hypothetical protein